MVMGGGNFMEEATVKKNKYEMDMCSGALLPKILLYSLPLMLSGVLQLLFNAADMPWRQWAPPVRSSICW